MPLRERVRRIKTVTHLDPELRARVDAIAEDEQEGNIARAVRELVREGLAARDEAQRAETVGAGG